MNSSLKSILEYEKKVTDLERIIHIPDYAPKDGEQVIWLSDDPANLWPIIASLADKPGSIVIDSLLKRKARCIPLILNYSKSFKIEISLDKQSENKKFKVLENHNIGSDAIISVTTKGVVRLGSLEKPPFVIDSSAVFFNLLMTLLIDEPDDMCQSIKSIRAEGPFKRIQGMKIIVHNECKQDFVDVAWLTVSGEENPDIKKRAEALINKTNAHIIIPLIIINGENASKTSNETDKKKNLMNCVEDLQQSLKIFSNRVVYPPLILNRTWYKQKTEERSYEDGCFCLLWNSTRISGLNTAIDRRLKAMTDFVMEKPTSVFGMMHQMVYLKLLKSFPDIELHYPDMNEFFKLREQGVEKFAGVSIPVSELEKALEEVSPEKILKTPTKPDAEVFIEHTVEFLNELTSMDFCKTKHKYFAQFSEKLVREGISWNDEKLNSVITNIDDLLNQVWHSLENIDVTLKSTMNDMKGQLALIGEQNSPFTPEYVDKAKFFWGEFFQLLFKNMELKNPDNEIRVICTSSTKNFLNLISHTPLDKKDFKKNLKERWLAFVKNTVKQINNVLDDTSQIWELKVKDELMKLEEFRKENHPKSL